MPNADFAQWPKPEEIAPVILFLCSDDAKVIHGAAVRNAQRRADWPDASATQQTRRQVGLIRTASPIQADCAELTREAVGSREINSRIYADVY